MSLQNKFEFLKTVKMPNNVDLCSCLKEYMSYNGPIADAGKYGYFVLYNSQDMQEDQKNLPKGFLTQKTIELEKNIRQLQKDHKVTSEGGDFFHIKVNDEDRIKTECRLYLRILPHNIHDVAHALMDSCISKNLPVHFKFCVSRMDSLVLYTDYDHVQTFIDLIEDIRKSSPELFENADKVHPLWGKVKGYIGFMEEPVIRVPFAKGSISFLEKSASTYRTRLLQEMENFYKEAKMEPSFVTTKFISRFTSGLDVDASHIPLNQSSVEELKKSGYNIDLIGRNFEDTYSTSSKTTSTNKVKR